jgi:hypothetical protein
MDDEHIQQKKKPASGISELDKCIICVKAEL